MDCQNYILDSTVHDNYKPKPCSQPPLPLPLIGDIVGIIIHWFDLMGLLGEIVEQSVVLTISFTDWNESENKGVGKDEQGKWQLQIRQHDFHEGFPHFHHRTRCTCHHWAGGLWSM